MFTIYSYTNPTHRAAINTGYLMAGAAFSHWVLEKDFYSSLKFMAITVTVTLTANAFVKWGSEKDASAAFKPVYSPLGNALSTPLAFGLFVPSAFLYFCFPAFVALYSSECISNILPRCTTYERDLILAATTIMTLAPAIAMPFIYLDKVIRYTNPILDNICCKTLFTLDAVIGIIGSPLASYTGGAYDMIIDAAIPLLSCGGAVIAQIDDAFSITY